MSREILRGQIYYMDLNLIIGHEQGGRRPVLVIQNDTGNRFSTTTIVAALTTRLPAKPYPTEVRLPAGAGGLDRASAVRLDQIRTVDKQRLERYVGALLETEMRRVDHALAISLGLTDV